MSIWYLGGVWLVVVLVSAVVRICGSGGFHASVIRDSPEEYAEDSIRARCWYVRCLTFWTTMSTVSGPGVGTCGV